MLIMAENLHQISFLQLAQIYYDPQAGYGGDSDFYTYLKDCFFGEYKGIYAIWEEKGRYVSALRLEPYKDGFLISGLETALEYRRRGCARHLLEGVLSQVSGKVYSHVMKNNIASLSLHQQCGFEKLSDSARYLDGSADSRAWTLLARGRGEGGV